MARHLGTSVALALSLAIGKAASADDGTWSILSPLPGISPTPNQHVSVIVPSREQIVAYGGSLGSDTWLLDLSALSWSKLTIANPPPGRLGACAIYDPARDQMVVFGGYTSTYVNEVWTLSLSGTPAWTQVTPSGTPPAARDYASAIYDPVRDRMIVFAGFSGNPYNDVWALDLASMTWSQLWPDRIVTSGTSPDQRSGAVAIYDPVGDRMVTAFGGTGESWTLSLSDPPTWTQLHPSVSPINRQYSSAVYDADSLRMVIFGGRQGTIGYADTWDLTLGVTPKWRQLSPVGAPSAARGQHTAMVDPSLHRMLILGGSGTGDLRSLTWGPGTPPPSITSVSPTSAHEGDLVTIAGIALGTVTAARFNGVPAVIQSNSNTLITVLVPFGATTGPMTLAGPFGSINAAADFVILFSPVIASFTPTSAEAGADVTITGRLFSNVGQVIFGSGQLASFTITSDTEVHATVNASATSGPILMTNPSGTTASATPFIFIPPAVVITSISPTSAAPGSFVYVTGQGLSTVTRVTFTGDTTNALIGKGDSQLVCRVPPNAQTGPIAVTNLHGSTPTQIFTVLRAPVYIASMSPASGSVGTRVAIDGLSLTNITRVTFAGDTAAAAWFLNLETEIVTWVTPNAQTGPITITNPYGSAQTPVFTVIPDQPTATLASLVSDVELPDRVILTWYLSSRGAPVNVYRRTPTIDWSLMGSQVPDGSGYVRYEDGSVLAGTNYGYRLGIRDAGSEVFAGEVWASVSPLSLSLDGVLPNPALSGRVTVSFALPTNDPASLELIDVTGRRVARRDVGSLGPGRHQVTLDDGGRVAPGMYLVRLVQGQSSRSKRAVVID